MSKLMCNGKARKFNGILIVVYDDPLVTVIVCLAVFIGKQIVHQAVLDNANAHSACDLKNVNRKLVKLKVEQTLPSAVANGFVNSVVQDGYLNAVDSSVAFNQRSGSSVSGASNIFFHSPMFL